MRFRLLMFLSISLLYLPPLRAQDTTRMLDEVMIRAYNLPATSLRTTAAIERLPAGGVAQWSPVSVVSAVNSLPGIRLEERSPGSYRLSMRGSALRSPFGVRNVKVYLQDIPFTDPGGVTYLNQLGPLQFAGATFIKGPGSSIYGAGTGGVLLLTMPAADTPGLTAGYSYGSYDQHTFLADVRLPGSAIHQSVSYQQATGQGYRQQSAMDRKLLQWSGRYRIGDKQELSAVLLLGKLHYETPGGLTQEEYVRDPVAARPAVNGFPSAVAAQAAIDQRMAWLGIGFKTAMGKGWRNQTGVSVAYTGLTNPAIRNYAVTTQPQTGIRSVCSYEQQYDVFLLRIHAGIETQGGWSKVQVYTNEGGERGALRSRERIRAMQGTAFVQTAFARNGWELIAGLSLNTMHIRYVQSVPLNTGVLDRNFKLQPMPRLVLSRRFGENAFAFASFSRGFSPPVTEELLPSGTAFNPALQPESGLNYELGLRYRPVTGLMVSLNAYYFSLKNTIVQRRDAGGGDYYINAGQTRQPGAEASLHYEGGLSEPCAWSLQGSYAFQPYQYASFVKGAEDYSGKALPGLAKHNFYAGGTLSLFRRITVSAHYYYNNAVPLNDGNTAYGDPAHLLSVKAGLRFSKGPFRFVAFAGAENLLNQRYSLGYDINAAGGRYYNAAPGRNYYLQLLLTR